MVAKVIDGRAIAKEIREEVKEEINLIKSRYNIVPNIVTILIGKNAESELYLRLRDNACKEVGISTGVIDIKEDASEKEIVNVIDRLNKNTNIHGILIQMPLPKSINFNRIISKVDPKKDVEGLHPENIGKTLLGYEDIVPITPLAVIKILDHENIKYEGKDVVIVNHSNIIGKPLALLLLNRNSSVSICHVFTKDLKSYTKNADVLITGTGVPRLIRKEHVKKGAFVIDVGIVRTKDGLCGDVDFDSVKEIAGIITPVPGGVGPVTVAYSLKNMIKTFKKCTGEQHE